LVRALKTTTDDADDALRLRALEIGAAIAIERFDPRTTERHANTSLELATRLTSPGSQMRTYGQRATAWFMRGQYKDAERDEETAYAMARRFQIARGLARCPTMLAMIQLQRGDLDRADALLEEDRSANAAVEQDRYVGATFALTEAWLTL